MCNIYETVGKKFTPYPPRARYPTGRKTPLMLHPKRGSDIVFTIVSKNYLAHARALMKSVRAIHPELTLITVLVDSVDDYFDPSQEPFETVLASELGIPRWAHFSMKYDIMELNTAVKPYAVQYLMERFDAQRVLYFDPDIIVYNQLDRLFTLLDDYLCILTPHITRPLDDRLTPSEIDFLRVGTYNLGFFAISRQGDWRGLLRWWQDRLYEHCTREVEKGLFVDQHWMDLVPSLFAAVYILRDVGYNVAYWNLSHRALSFSPENGYRVQDEPLVFFHFSGFSVKQPEMVSRHQNRFRFDNLNPATKQCYLDYRQRLLDEGFEEVSKFPYAYGRFANGVEISDVLRICLRTHDSRGDIWPTPYQTDSPDSFLTWATTPGSHPPYNFLSPYALTLYATRPDFKTVFPALETQHELAFARWFTQQTQPADIFSSAYVKPVQQRLDGVKGTTSLRSLGLPWHRRLSKAIRYYRRVYPANVKPYLPPEAFTEVSTYYTGPNNLYGVTRNALWRLGILRAIKRLIGMRLVMTAREYFGGGPLTDDERGQPAYAPPISSGDGVEAAPDTVYGVTVVGYLAAETGIGQMARSVLMCLKNVQFPVSGYLLKTSGEYRQQDMSAYALTTRINHFVQVFNVNADQTHVVYDRLGADFYRGHYNIGYWFWELSDFPTAWNNAFDLYDEIWVATRFVQAAIQATTSKPVLCIPAAVSVSLPDGSNRAQFGLKDDDFVVLYTFDALSIIERKNPWAVISAFELAYTEPERRSKVRLVLKVTNLGQTSEADLLRSEVRRVNGLLIEGYLSRLETNALMNECDIYISLHRSEGFGLTLAEAMSLGKPVIGTAYSGNIDFMTEENSYLVPYQLVALGRDYPPYEAHHVWADPDVPAAARYLRDIYDDYDSAKRKGAAAAQHIQQHYSVKARGGQIAERLRSILSQYQVHTPPAQAAT